MDGATELTKIKDRWSAFCRSVTDVMRAARARVATASNGMLACRKAPPAVAQARARPKPLTSEQAPSGEFWLSKEPEWFVAVLILVFLGLIEALSWATASWPPCLVA